jgi:3-oxoacyl-(acyl-carrier-protein) synthase
MSAPLEDGAQTASALQRALDDAGVSNAEVEAINAHGSSTHLGDRAESRAYAQVFGDRGARIPAAATKGQHAHALGATGAWEIAVALLGMGEGIVPGAVNLDRPAGDCAINCAREARRIDARIVLSNSSGFGGINAAVVLRAAG